MQLQSKESGETIVSKVPQVTLMFWLIKICATTVGETGGDALSMTFELGYAVSCLIFLAFFLVTASPQVASRRYHAFLYWAVVVATTTLGTTMSDYLDRTLGLGYPKASALLFTSVLLILGVWWLTMGRVKFENITLKCDELFYWLTILVANTLGTALGDYVADDRGFGFERGALLFAALIGVVAVLHFLTTVPGSILFWTAYILTRPLGATLGDTLTKPQDQGGLNLSRVASTLVIAGLMVVGILVTMRQMRAEPVLAAQADLPSPEIG
jgi:uncharacterized membrane-anchored protein